MLEERDAYPRVSDETFADDDPVTADDRWTIRCRRMLEERDAYPRVSDETFADDAPAAEVTAGIRPAEVFSVPDEAPASM